MGFGFGWTAPAAARVKALRAEDPKYLYEGINDVLFGARLAKHNIRQERTLQG